MSDEATPFNRCLPCGHGKAGVAAFISGAGPTVLVLHTGGATEVAELTHAAGPKFRVEEVAISAGGVLPF